MPECTIQQGDLVTDPEYMDVIWKVQAVHDMYAWILPHVVLGEHHNICARSHCYCGSRGLIAVTGKLTKRSNERLLHYKKRRGLPL